MKWKYILAWIGMVFIAIANGAIRETLFKQPLGDLKAHQLSVVVGSILFGIFIWMIIRSLSAPRTLGNKTNENVFV